MSWQPQYFIKGPGWRGVPGPSPQELEDPESLYWNTRANWMMEELIQAFGCGRVMGWMRKLYPNGILNWQELAEDAERMLRRVVDSGLMIPEYTNNNGRRKLVNERNAMGN